MHLEFSSADHALVRRYQLSLMQQLNLAQQRSTHASRAPGTVSNDDQQALKFKVEHNTRKPLVNAGISAVEMD
jgi:heme-binding NEAT domain protein